MNPLVVRGYTVDTAKSNYVTQMFEEIYAEGTSSWLRMVAK